MNVLCVFPSKAPYPDRAKLLETNCRQNNVNVIFLNDVSKGNKWWFLIREMLKYQNTNLILHDFFISRAGILSLFRKKQTVNGAR